MPRSAPGRISGRASVSSPRARSTSRRSSAAARDARVEIGFGNGEALVALAASRPAEDFLGIEVHRPGVGHLMLRCEELAVRNLRIICRDAVDVLEQQLPPACLDEVLLYFPDPWPKKRHHKRRIVQDGFVALVASRLRSGGIVPAGDRLAALCRLDARDARPQRAPAQRITRWHVGGATREPPADTLRAARPASWPRCMGPLVPKSLKRGNGHEALPPHAASAPRMPSSMN